jgi:hypothetical protein
MATLHKSNFVKIECSQSHTNKLPLWPFWDKNHLIGLKIHSWSKTKNTPPFCLKRTKGKQSRKTINKYNFKVQRKKEFVKSPIKHLAEMGAKDNEVSPFTRKAAHTCI